MTPEERRQKYHARRRLLTSDERKRIVLERPNAQRRQVERWNAKHRVGTRVLVEVEEGQFQETRTASPAKMLSAVVAVIWLEGQPCPYLLSRVRPLGDRRRKAA